MTKAQDAALFLKSTIKADIPVVNPPVPIIEYLQTGTLPFDVLLGGGLPLGRITEMTGAFQTLKTWLALSTARVAQLTDGYVVYIDTEKSFDARWAAQVGVDTSNVIVHQPATGEEALGMAEALLQSEHVPDLLVWDSIAATTTAEQASKSASETDRVASLARFMSRALNRLNTANRRTAILLINQERSNINATSWGSQVSFPGGKAAEYYASQRVNVKRGSSKTSESKEYRDGKEATVKHRDGQVYVATLTKSRVKASHDEVYFTWLNDGRIDELGFALDQAVNLGLVTVNAKRFEYEGVGGTEFWRFRKAMESQPPEVQQGLMEKVLFARCPSLVATP